MATTAGLTERLAQFEAALSAVLTGKSYTMMGKTMTRADERWITEQIEILESRIYRRGGGVSHVEQRFIPNR